MLYFISALSKIRLNCSTTDKKIHPYVVPCCTTDTNISAEPKIYHIECEVLKAKKTLSIISGFI